MKNHKNLSACTSTYTVQFVGQALCVCIHIPKCVGSDVTQAAPTIGPEWHAAFGLIVKGTLREGASLL